MTDVSYDYDIPDAGRDRKGFTQTLREMRKGGSVEVPLAKKPSIYSAAKAAGAKVRIRATDHNTVRVWRLDGEEPPKPFNDGLNIFGQPLKPEPLR
jgi:hypothetical protein